MLMKAVKIATSLHHGQYRKHTGHSKLKLPYITHPIEVAKMLWQWGVSDEEILTAAICHDLIEDTQTTYDKLAAIFGRTVAGWVDDLTFYPPKAKHHKSEAKAAYIKTFATKSLVVLVIKLADRLCNVRDYMMGDSTYAKTYYEKAEPLLRAWEARQQEIIEYFGKEMHDRMSAEFTMLTQCLHLAQVPEAQQHHADDKSA